MKVEVKQKHIDEGTPYAEDSCPLALAIQEQGGPAWVGDIIQLSSSRCSLEHAVSFRHTKVSAKFIQDFDDGREVKPHTFLFKEIE